MFRKTQELAGLVSCKRRKKNNHHFGSGGRKNHHFCSGGRNWHSVRIIVRIVAPTPPEDYFKGEVAMTYVIAFDDLSGACF